MMILLTSFIILFISFKLVKKKIEILKTLPQFIFCFIQLLSSLVFKLILILNRNRNYFKSLNYILKYFLISLIFTSQFSFILVLMILNFRISYLFMFQYFWFLVFHFQSYMNYNCMNYKSRKNHRMNQQNNHYIHHLIQFLILRISSFIICFIFWLLQLLYVFILKPWLFILIIIFFLIFLIPFQPLIILILISYVLILLTAFISIISYVLQPLFWLFHVLIIFIFIFLIIPSIFMPLFIQ